MGKLNFGSRHSSAGQFFRCNSSTVPMGLTEQQLHWLAGLLEGEGSFCCGPPSKPNAALIAIEMIDRDVIEKVAGIFRTTLVECGVRQHWQQTYRAQLRGSRAVELMTTLRPLMSLRRQIQIDRAVASFHPHLDHWTRRARPWPSDSALLAMASLASLRTIAADLSISHQAVHHRLRRLRKTMPP